MLSILENQTPVRLLLKQILEEGSPTFLQEVVVDKTGIIPDTVEPEVLCRIFPSRVFWGKCPEVL